MNEETRNLVKELANELGTTAEHLWGVLISQAKVEVFQIILFFIFSLLLTFVTYRIHKYYTKNKKYDRYDNELYIASTVFLGMVSVVILGACIFKLFSLPTLIYNPEYWALNEVLGNI